MFTSRFSQCAKKLRERRRSDPRKLLYSGAVLLEMGCPKVFNQSRFSGPLEDANFSFEHFRFCWLLLALDHSLQRGTVSYIAGLI